MRTFGLLCALLGFVAYTVYARVEDYLVRQRNELISKATFPPKGVWFDHQRSQFWIEHTRKNYPCAKTGFPIEKRHMQRVVMDDCGVWKPVPLFLYLNDTEPDLVNWVYVQRI